MTQKSDNIRWHGSELSSSEREKHLGVGAVVWFTGLSGSGKSTVARAVEAALVRQGHSAYVLDGDNLRFGLNTDLGFSAADRRENIRRVGEVAKLFAGANVILLAAFISPYQKDRDAIRSSLLPNRFVEVHVSTSIEVCAERDPKGLYAKAQRGEIENFTGISAPYEAPVSPELKLDTGTLSLENSVMETIDVLRSKGVLPPL